MKTPEPTLAPTNAPRRPSLFEQPDRPVRVPHREIAVLAPFEAPRSNALSPHWATAGVVAVATAFTLLCGATLWAVFKGDTSSNIEPRPIASRDAGPKAVAATPVSKAATTPASPAPIVAAADLAKEAAPQQAATIISETPRGAAAIDPAGSTNPLMVALQQPAPPVADPIPASTPVTEKPAAPVTTSAVTAKHIQPAAPHANEAKVAPKKNKPKIEPDTILLAALVSHVQATDASALKTSHRDVVTADRTSSTAELVARCERLGGQEAKLCRNRICKGLWGVESACPAR